MQARLIRYIGPALLSVTALLASPAGIIAQDKTANATVSSSSSDRWLHVRVTSSEDRTETVRVNVPLEMAEKVLPAINKDRLHNGKVRFDEHDMNCVDVKALLDAVRTSKDGEYVTVQGTDADVRVAKQGGYLFVHVTERILTPERQDHGKVQSRSEGPDEGRGRVVLFRERRAGPGGSAARTFGTWRHRTGFGKERRQHGTDLAGLQKHFGLGGKENYAHDPR